MNDKIKPVVDLISTSGMNDKKEIITNNVDNHFFYYYTYYLLNPHMNYFVSEKTLRKAIKDNPTTHYDIDEFTTWCEHLNSLKSINNTKLAELAHWISDIPDVDEQELMIGLYSKSTRLGVGATTFNKVKRNWIPVWEVQQAFSINNITVPDGERFWLTQKLNGVRATYYKGKFYSRNGSEYKGLEHITKELKSISHLENGFVIDGELTLRKEGQYANVSDNEAFRISTGIINSDAETKNEIIYTIFDIVPVSDFDSNEPSMKYSRRRDIMKYISAWFAASSNISVLPVLYVGKDKSQIEPLLDKMVAEDKEGLMLNRDVPYYRKRHDGILKIKKFYTMDLRITDMVNGTGRNKNILGCLVVDFDGNEVRVGSGFSDDQRNYLWTHKDEIIGMLCEVKYKEISYNKSKNTKSLQFPVFVQIRNDKDTISFD